MGSLKHLLFPCPWEGQTEEGGGSLKSSQLPSCPFPGMFPLALQSVDRETLASDNTECGGRHAWPWGVFMGCPTGVSRFSQQSQGEAAISHLPLILQINT